MTNARIRPLVAKEIRALLPAWFATLCAMAGAALSLPRGHTLGLFAYGFGSIALGAQSVGHEYTHRTLPLLLAQPASRRRLFLVKLGALTVMMLTLAGVADLALLKPGDLPWLYATVFFSLFAASLLTMLSRNPLAGLVLTGAAPVWAMVLSDAINPAVLRGMTLAITVVAALASWRLFIRLEAIDGRQSELELPRGFRQTPIVTALPADTVRRRHRLWQLVKKELHVQQLTFAVAGMCAVFSATVWVLPRFVPEYAGFPLAVAAILYGALLAVLIGSLASAEERRIGTLEWQMLQPVAAWQQWAVKVVTAVILAELLSFVLPVVFAAGQVQFDASHAAAVLAVTIGSLYVSSLCRNGIRALTLAGPIMLSLVVLWTYAAGIYSIGYRGEHLWALTAVPLTGVVALMLWFGLENHRTAAQGAGRVVRQVLWMAGTVAIGVAVVAAVP